MARRDYNYYKRYGGVSEALQDSMAGRISMKKFSLISKKLFDSDDKRLRKMLEIPGYINPQTLAFNFKKIYAMKKYHHSLDYYHKQNNLVHKATEDYCAGEIGIKKFSQITKKYLDSEMERMEDIFLQTHLNYKHKNLASLTA